MTIIPISWVCRIRWLHLCCEVRPYPNECPGYDTKLFEGEALILELWGMWSTPSLPSLPGPLWLRVVVSIKVLSLGQIEPLNHLLYRMQIKPLLFDNNTWNNLTVCKQMSSSSFKNCYLTKYSFTNHIYLVYVYKQDLALNNQKRLICRKTPTNQPKQL